MANKRYYNLLLLLLLLLAISCNFKSRQSDVSLKGTRLEGKLSVGKPTIKNSLDKKTFIESLFEGKVTIDDVLKLELSVDEGEDDEDAVSEAGTEESMEVKINKLLDGFELSDKAKDAVRSLQSILTDPDIGRGEGYRTYTDSEFYDLMASLGDVKSNEIIEAHLTILAGRERLQEAIENINGELAKRFKPFLQNEIKAQEEGYPLYIKDVFTGSNLKRIFSLVTGYKDASLSKFSKTQYMVDAIIDGKDPLEGLSDVELRGANLLQGILTDSKIGDKTYSDDEFSLLLFNLGTDRAREIIRSHLDVVEELEKTNIAIDAVGDEKSKQNLKDDLTKQENEYLLSLKGALDWHDFPDRICNAVKSCRDRYVNKYVSLGDEAGEL
ncbi:hypothetical protein A0V01_05125 (plasmid) [Borrelia hermsii]|uniref:Lipoprotein n=1 Tax=Borrelia hermsii TaxID=140 RepID=A0AAN0X6S1_BORHE|nr:hypothetical protein [Borrelia hermsii]AMR75997.1 hypothetical protein A0V01_05125 [Borrelia hermsii]UPA08595.1 hypothetical protein bhDAH_001308 [Borrelia hermsii DAH]